MFNEKKKKQKMYHEIINLFKRILQIYFIKRNEQRTFLLDLLNSSA